MRTMETKRDGLTLYCGDVREVCAALPPASVDLIVTDPPYFRVKDEPWDRQWDTPEGFLAWVGQLCEAWRRVLKPNGSLYVFASPQMAARVEVTVGQCFNVLNRIRWVKDAGWHNKTDEETLRAFLSPWEEIVFAEQWGADHSANDEAGWGLRCQELHKQVYGPVVGRRVAQIREQAGLTRQEVDTFCSPSRKPTGLCYRWEAGDCLPTLEQYETLCRACGDVRPTEALRSEYEALRSEYEALRRPFQATPDAPYTDVWDFPTVPAYPGKHPCEKPQDLLRHIVQVSSRPGAVVFDCCMGSGATGEAALSLGRQFIGCDVSEHWAQYAAARLDRRFGALPQGPGRVTKRKAPREQPSLLEVAG